MAVHIHRIAADAAVGVPGNEGRRSGNVNGQR